MMTFNCSFEIKEKLQDQLSNIKGDDIFFVEINDETFMTLDRHNENCVFIVEDGKYIFDLLEFRPIGFIRKQFMDDDIENIKKLLIQKVKIQKTLLMFNNSGNKLSVTSDRILYLEAQSHDVIVNTTTIAFKVRERISDLASRLSPYGFKQVHRSYLINEDHLIAYTQDECILTGNIKVPLSRKYKM